MSTKCCSRATVPPCIDPLAQYNKSLHRAAAVTRRGGACDGVGHLLPPVMLLLQSRSVRVVNPRRDQEDDDQETEAAEEVAFVTSAAFLVLCHSLGLQINELSSSPGANDGEEALEAPLGRAEVGLGAAAARRGQVVVPGVGERRFSALVRVQLHPQHLHHNSPSS